MPGSPNGIIGWPMIDICNSRGIHTEFNDSQIPLGRRIPRRMLRDYRMLSHLESIAARYPAWYHDNLEQTGSAVTSASSGCVVVRTDRRVFQFQRQSGGILDGIPRSRSVEKSTVTTMPWARYPCPSHGFRY